VRSENIHCDFAKARNPETFWKSAWINYHHRVEEVKEAKRTAVEAVRARENASRTQNPGYFGQQSILQRLRRDVVQHREAQRGIERSTGERHRCGILAKDVDIAATQTMRKRIRQRPVNLYAVHPLNTLAKEVRRYARAGSNLQYILPEIKSFNHPGKNVFFDGIPPVSGPA